MSAVVSTSVLRASAGIPSWPAALLVHFLDGADDLDSCWLIAVYFNVGVCFSDVWRVLGCWSEKFVEILALSYFRIKIVI
jgi:hypothetical protein